MHRDCKDLRVALFLNTLSSHSLPLVACLSTKVKELIVFTSASYDQKANPLSTAAGNIQIMQQRNISVRRVRRHPQGYSDPMDIHIPYDTLFQLIARRPDAVITLEFGMRTLQALIYRILRPSSRLIIWAPLSERTEQGRGKMRESLRRFILRKADAVLVNGKSGFRYIHNLGGDSRKIFIAPELTNVDLFRSISPTRPAEDAYRLLYVGQLIERKGLLPFLNTLIRWIELHPTKRVEFVMVGEGPIRSKLEELLLPNNLALSLPGRIEYLDLPTYYAKAGIFVFPTLADEWGLVVNEAMMTGLPVLGSIYSQSVEELIEDHINGWIFTPDHPQSAFHALDAAMSTPFAALENMRVSARTTAEKLTPDAIADIFLSALRFAG
jgi:glycosyltransferase involved in cell wall biosynthesis